LLATAQALAMEKTDDIDTNRPSFMDSPLVLPRASVQLENGTLFQGFHKGQWQYDIPETEVRIGLTKNTEFQGFTPNYNLLRSRVASNSTEPGANSTDSFHGVTSSQVSDITGVGLKHQLGPLFAASN